MNWKSTLLLVVLAAVACVWLWKGNEWGQKLGLKPSGPPADSPQLTAMEADFTPATITRLEVTPHGGTPFSFESYEIPDKESGKPKKAWKQSGNWPLRAKEVGELAELLGTLRTRFQPVPLPENADLTAFGLAETQQPITVKVNAGGKEYTLKFGEPPVPTGETAFTRIAYVRVNNANEVLQLGPDVMPLLRRPAETYLRRQLFYDVDRVKIAGVAPPTPPGVPPPDAPPPTAIVVPGDSISEIRIVSRGKKLLGVTPWWANHDFTLKRIASTPAPTVTAKSAEASVQPDRLAECW